MEILKDTLFWRGDEIDMQKHANSCLKNMIDLSFFGVKDTSVIIQSILASSLPRKVAKKYIHDEYLSLSENVKEEVSEQRRLMGRKKLSSLRKTYKIIMNGKHVPKHNYTFRIDSNKICNTISFLQTSLQVKPGHIHNRIFCCPKH